MRPAGEKVARRQDGKTAGVLKRRVLAGVVLLGVGVFAMTILKRSPSTTRNWAADQALPAASLVDGHVATIRNVRNFRYPAGAEPVPGFYDARYDLDSLETAWFVLTTFSKSWRAPAHTFASFGFAGGRYVAISVEARREAGQSYGIVAGMLRNFELIYVIGDERDLIGRRAVAEGDNTYLYPVNAPKERIRELFVAMLARANLLQQQPEFYHSVFNSCATNLVAHVNQVVPGRIPATWKVMVPGYADEVALSLGLIQTGDSLAGARQRFLINERARAAMPSDSFSALIRR
jgi:hypothetical protein